MKYSILSTFALVLLAYAPLEILRLKSNNIESHIEKNALYKATSESSLLPFITPGFEITTNDTELYTCPSVGSDAVFLFNYSTIQGFSETTVFSATGLPPGATAIFNPTSLNSDGTFTLTLGNINATAEGTYTIAVTGNSSPSGETKTINVTLNNNCTFVQCNTYSKLGVNKPISDGLGSGWTITPGPALYDTITVSDNVIIKSLTFSLNVTHTKVGDLAIRLYHPNGTTRANGWLAQCGNYDDIDITFQDGAPSVQCGNPTSGTYRPQEALSVFNGLAAQGDWRIFISDFYQGDTGTLNNWALEICTERPLSIADRKPENIHIYPNPNRGEFKIDFSPNTGDDIIIEVFDFSGRLILRKTYHSQDAFNELINLNEAESGVYLLRITEGLKKVTKKIIVQ